MRTHEIPRSEWPTFLNAFGQQHQGWLATMEIVDPAGRMITIEQRPLQDAIVESDPRGGSRIALVFGHRDSPPVTESIEMPQRVLFVETEEHGHVGLEIELGDGKKAVVRFRSHMPPEMVDGIAA